MKVDSLRDFRWEFSLRAPFRKDNTEQIVIVSNKLQYDDQIETQFLKLILTD